ncbi:MAG: POTRA domain-containing protein [Bdellovibrionales bacterium]
MIKYICENKIMSLFSCGLFFLLASRGFAGVEFSEVSAHDIEVLQKDLPDLKNPHPKYSTFDEVIRKLMKLDIYSSIQIDERTEGNFIVSANRLRTIGVLSVRGNKSVDTEEIIQIIGLKQGMRFDSGKLIESEEKLKEYYAKKGFFNSEINLNFEEAQSKELNVIAQITENAPCLIKTINIKTENTTLNTKFNKLIKKYINTNFTERAITYIETDLNEYLIDNRFINSQLIQREAKYNSRKTSVDLVYDLIDPYTYEIYLENNSYYSVGQIMSHLNLESLTKGSSNPEESVSQLVKDYYLSTGFSNVKITMSSNVFKNDFIKRIHIQINEGSRTFIEKISVAGRITRTAKDYETFIKEHSSEVVQDGYYVKSDLENGYKNLITDLNNKGYLHVKLQSSRVEYNNKRDRVMISVVLDEGPLTQLKEIRFSGVHAFSEKILLDNIESKKNSPLKLYQLEESIQNIKQFYFNQGFIEMKILNEDESLVEYDDSELKATLNIKISEGPKVYIKAIVLEGNTFTKDYVILRELGIEVGDILTPYTLDEAQKRIEKLTLFSNIEIKTLEANTTISRRTLIISVLENNPGLFKFGVGLTNKRDLTLRGFSGLSYNNIMGTGRAVSLRGTLENNLRKNNFLEYEINLAYLEPFIFEQRLRGRANYTRSDKFSSDTQLLTTDSVNFSIERDLTSRIKFSWLAWGLDSIQHYSVPAVGPRRHEDTIKVGYVGPSLDLNFTDNLFSPTKGFYSKIDAEYAAPEIGSSKNIQFVRSQAQFTHYQRMFTPKVIWANSVRGGYEKNLSTEPGSGVPLSFAFFLGGYTTIRGYSGSDVDRIPSSTEFSYSPSNQLVIPKESDYYMIKSELRFPLGIDPWGAAIFYDAGEVDIQGVHFKNPFRQSAGVGLRINTPVGPLSIDYGRKIGGLNEKSMDAWHVSIGAF